MSYGKGQGRGSKYLQVANEKEAYFSLPIELQLTFLMSKQPELAGVLSLGCQYLGLGDGLVGKNSLRGGEDGGEVADIGQPSNSDCLQWSVRNCYSLRRRLKTERRKYLMESICWLVISDLTQYSLSLIKDWEVNGFHLASPSRAD